VHPVDAPGLRDAPRLQIVDVTPLRRREGAGALEYMLIIVAISIVMFIAFRLLGETVIDWFNTNVICEFSGGATSGGSTCGNPVTK
jgi:Flp pilus assembly pilin Flp